MSDSFLYVYRDQKWRTEISMSDRRFVYLKTNMSDRLLVCLQRSEVTDTDYRVWYTFRMFTEIRSNGHRIACLIDFLYAYRDQKWRTQTSMSDRLPVCLQRSEVTGTEWRVSDVMYVYRDQRWRTQTNVSQTSCMFTEIRSDGHRLTCLRRHVCLQRSEVTEISVSHRRHVCLQRSEVTDRD
jgi:hypothetical protein